MTGVHLEDISSRLMKQGECSSCRMVHPLPLALDESEDSVQVTCSVLTNETPCHHQLGETGEGKFTKHSRPLSNQYLVLSACTALAYSKYQTTAKNV